MKANLIMWHRLSACVAAFLLSPCLAAADTVELKGGHKIIGEVLKSDEHAVIVDLGFTVVRAPRSEVIRVVGEDGKVAKAALTAMPSSLPASGPAVAIPAVATMPAAVEKSVDVETKAQVLPAGPAVTAPAERNSPQWQLYHTADLKETTIQAAAERYGEAVIMVSSPDGLGSGFIISPDGYCITNYHVVAQETRLKATVFRRTETGYEQKHYRDVRIIALNPFVDLALLRIESPGEKFKYVYLGSMEDLKTGQEVFAIGNPLGLTRTVSSGIVSTTNRNFEGDLYIQTTTDINPGNSGGPLFNLRGEVVGVTSMGYIFLSGLNFAIPADVVERFIINRDAYAYDEDNPNSGHRYHQPTARINRRQPPAGKLPVVEQ